MLSSSRGGTAQVVDFTGHCRYHTRSSVMNRVLITLGAALIVLGAAWSWIRRLPLFRLPGDIIVDRPDFKFFLPLTTMVLISAAISLIAWILRK